MSFPPLLIADDDQALCELLSQYLANEGFELDCVHRGDAVAAALHKHSYALLILDVMLPGMSGFEVLKQLRSGSPLPVLMLTARGDDVDRIVGLELGADDYLPKPFNPRELSARVKAILRRARSTPAHDQTLRNGPLNLSRASHEAFIGTTPLELTSAEFELLRVLLSATGQCVSKERLAREALQRPLNAFDRAIDVHISHLRRKLAAAGGDRDWLVARRGQGYQLLQLEKP